MEDKGKTKVELIKNLKTLRKKREKSAANNIIERKQAEEKLNETEEYLKILFDYAPDAYYINDLKGNFIDGNRAAERLIGCKREELIGKNFIKLKLLSAKDMPKATKSLAKNIMGHPTGPDEYVLYRKDKSTVEVEISNYPVKIKGRTLVLGIARDITERKKAEKALVESEEKYRTVFKNTGTATMVIEEDETISMVNTQYEKLSGYSKEEIENKMKWANLIVPEDLERVKKYHIERRKAGGKAPAEYEFRMMDKKGNIKDIFLKTGMMSNSKKSIASLTDITRRKQAEKRIGKIQSLRNAISDINQLLVRVKSESELFQQICNFLIKVEEIRFVWIGLTNSENFKVSPVAQAGFEEGYLSSIKVTWDDSKYGNGPTGTALKTSQPFIMRNIEDDPKFEPWKNDALKRGYLSSIALPLIYKKEPIGALNVYSGIKGAFTNEKVKFLKEVSRDITIGIRSLRLALNLQQSYQKLKKTMDTTIETMSKIVETKDPYTAGHQRRVCQLAIRIAQELSLPEDKIEGIRIASLIHDIGKIGLPTEILSKPTRLSDIEFSLIKTHSQIGYDILKSIDFSYPVARIVLQHHERLNGSGYPNNLRGNKIILEARILGVADVVEAMSSYRPYRPALGVDKALEEISQNKGILYEPKVVDACLKLFKEKGFKFE